MRGIQCQFHRDAHLPRLLIRQKAFGAILDPAYRPLQLARCPRRQHVFRLHTRLHAERAPHIFAQHANIGRPDVEVAVGHAVAQVERRLVRGVHHHASIAVDLSPRAAGLHRVGRDTRHGELQARHMRRITQGIIRSHCIATLP
jgi:hypothetical protein